LQKTIILDQEFGNPCLMSYKGWRVSEVPFMGILASAVQSPVGRSGASLGILWLVGIPSFDVRLKPFAQPPAVSQNANAVQAFERSAILANGCGTDETEWSLQ